MAQFTIAIANPSHAYDDLADVADIRVGNPPKKPANTQKEMVELVQDADAMLITSRERITRQVIEAGTDLEIIVKYGAPPDPEKVDFDAATEHGVVIGYTGGSNVDSVAEHTIMLMLAVSRNLSAVSARLERGEWKERGIEGYELMNKTVGLVGCGRVGNALVDRLSEFDVDVILYDPYVDRTELAKIGLPADDLEHLLRESDVVSIHCPLTEETRGLIGAEELAMMKSTAVLVNTARGAIVDERALHEALTAGELHGAGLDVFAEEPPRENPLIDLPNTVVTPHLAGVTTEVLQRETELAHTEVLSVLRGGEPRWVANPEVLS